MPLFFTDSNVFVYSQVRDLPESELAQAKLDEIRSKGDIAVNSVILSECFYVLSKFLGNEEASKRVNLLVDSSKVVYLPIEKSTMLKAIKLAVTHSKRINDMIVAQHTLDSKADGLLTDNTKQFSGIPELRTYSMR